MQVGSAPYDYTFDPNGNMRSETTSRHFEWNHSDQLKAFATQTDGAEPSLHAHYLYDSAGQRVKKLVRKQGGQAEVAHYIDAVFEHHRWTSGLHPGGNNLLHVVDDQQRIALVRVGAPHPDDQGPTEQFQLSDHLGSGNAVIDKRGVLVNREEFTAYGQTTFGSFRRKRYRFMGKERDEESSVNYHSARYYSPVTCRWLSCDPAGVVDGSNLFCFCRCDPINMIDHTGHNSEQAEAELRKAQNLERAALKQIEHFKEQEGLQGDLVAIRKAEIKHFTSQIKRFIKLERSMGSSMKEIDKGKLELEGRRGKAEAKLERSLRTLQEAREGLKSANTQLKEASKAIRAASQEIDRLRHVPDKDSLAEVERDHLSEADLSDTIDALPKGPPGEVLKGLKSVAEGGIRGAGALLTIWAVYKSGQAITNAVRADIDQGTGGEQTAKAVAHHAGGWALGLSWGAAVAPWGAVCGPATWICAPVIGLGAGTAGFIVGSNLADTAIILGRAIFAPVSLEDLQGPVRAQMFYP